MPSSIFCMSNASFILFHTSVHLPVSSGSIIHPSPSPSHCASFDPQALRITTSCPYLLAVPSLSDAPIRSRHPSFSPSGIPRSHTKSIKIHHARRFLYPHRYHKNLQHIPDSSAAFILLSFSSRRLKSRPQLGNCPCSYLATKRCTPEVKSIAIRKPTDCAIVARRSCTLQR